MRARSIALALLASLTLAAPALAKDPAAAEKPAPEKKICRRGAPTTGSIMGAKPVCHTKAEWTKIDDANAQNARQLLDRRVGQ